MSINVFSNLGNILNHKNASKESYFIEKDIKIRKAIEKVEDKLLQLREKSQIPLENWSEEDRKNFENWNNYHDLKYRLENRLWDNWSENKNWHFETYEFNTY